MDVVVFSTCLKTTLNDKYLTLSS